MLISRMPGKFIGTLNGLTSVGVMQRYYVMANSNTTFCTIFHWLAMDSIYIIIFFSLYLTFTIASMLFAHLYAKIMISSFYPY